MPRGGVRPGAGRPRIHPLKPPVHQLPPGPPPVATIAAGLTPLEVMIEAMRWFRAQAAKEQLKSNPDKKGVRNDLSKAAKIANDAAPYIHARADASEDEPKLGKKEQAIKDANAVETDSQWSNIIRTPAERVN